MISITKNLILQTQKLVNFIVLEEENRSPLVRPYTNDICAHWRFKTPDEAVESSNHIFGMYLDYRDEEDFIGMDMCRKF
ncbi:MAG: hypothetical protein CM15mV2_2570 [uncultured marine virus]|nr:MAG: hypothetical protein CM15mV2_2570 [uncultured marine virus]